MFSGGLKLSDDDDDDFAIGNENGVSSLSNIFGVTVKNPQEKDTPSLRYVSPKQSKPLNSAPATENASTDGTQDWKVQVAKVVTAFKLLNQENISQGKIGLAILRNIEDDRLRLILYRSKNNVLSTCTLKDDTVIYRNNLYLQFHDDLQLFWSILFQQEDLNEVLTFIGSSVKTQEAQQQQSEPVTNDRPSTPKSKHSDQKFDENSSDERLKETKANILSRMAKMGQPLPKFHASQSTNTDISDSSDTEVKAKVLQKPTVAARKPKVQSLVPVAASNMHLVPSNNFQFVPASNAANLAVADSQYMNVLLAENRTQNSELRMNISKLETKIEKVLDKIEVLNSRSGDEKHDNKEDEILALEEKILELKKENRAQKLRIQEMETKQRSSIPNSLKGSLSGVLSEISRSSDVSHKAREYFKLICQFVGEGDNSLSDSLVEAERSLTASELNFQSLNSRLEDTERRLEGSNQEIESLRLQLAGTKLDNEDFSRKVKEYCERRLLGSETNEDRLDLPPSLKTLHEKLTSIPQLPGRDQKSKLLDIIDEMTTEMQSLSDSLVQTKKSLDTSQSELKTVTLESENKDKLLSELKTNYEKEIQILKDQLRGANREKEELIGQLTKQSSPSAEQTVKEIMNNLYQNLSEKFEQKETFTAIEVTKICAHAIKTETNNLIKKK